MSSMTHVRQKHAKGCVVACLSMISGIPYDDIISDFEGDRHVEGTTQGDVWLAYKGFAVARKYRHYGIQVADRAVWPCEPFADVHLVTVNGGSHAVVWLRDGTVLDPARAEPSHLSEYSNIANIAGVWKVGEETNPGPLTYLHRSHHETSKCIYCGAHSDSYKHRDPCPARNK